MKPNRITELFGIQYPVIAGGMVWCSGWRLAGCEQCWRFGTAGRWQYASRNPYRAHRQDERRHRQALGHQHSADVP